MTTIIPLIIGLGFLGAAWFYVRAKCNPDTKGRTYNPAEYFRAEQLQEEYHDRAVAVYRALDPTQELIPEEGATASHITVADWINKGEEEPRMSVYLHFDWESNDSIGRMAIIPFEVLNWNMQDKEFLAKHIEIVRKERNHPYGGGGHIWLIFKLRGY